jgi:hypothetical protein
MTHAFAESIRSALTGSAAPHRKPPPDVNAEARLEYLKYRHYFATWSREDHKVIGHPAGALIDPTHAYATRAGGSLAVLGYRAKRSRRRTEGEGGTTRCRSILPSEAHEPALVKGLHDWDGRVQTEIHGPRTQPEQRVRALPARTLLATIERDRAERWPS